MASITMDPYDVGWLVEVEATNKEADRDCLLDAQAYLTMEKAKAEEKAQKKS